MYLKNIEVQGFKSFAQKINFEFHNGITGIVGPNGSGKSNVADAVRWVLGEQSAKQLRGGNMQDVIFSGTETRKPLSYAYVAITLDNSDRQLPIDYNEVTVARRLYRSGESEYLLNGGVCRLRDINELFYDTGIGKEGYSIIGQGQIDKILSGKPEDRRELFDEAAGIVKFKRRKNTTLKKLSEEQQNLVRVTDILNELNRQLEPLKRQSETAKVYLQKKEELKKLDINLFLQEMECIEAQLKEIGEKYSIAEGNLKETTASYEETRQEYERLEKELEELEIKITKKREEIQENALKKQQLEGQVDVLKEQIHATRLSEEHFAGRHKTLKEEISQKAADSKEYEQEKQTYQEQTAKILKQQRQIENKLENLRGEIEGAQAAVEDGKNEIIELLNARVTTKGKIQRFDTMMEQLEIRKSQLAQRTLLLKNDENSHQEQLSLAQQKYEQITDEISVLEEKTRLISERMQELSQSIQQLGRKQEQTQGAYHRDASRLEAIRNMTERYDGYGNSIRKIMEKKADTPGIFGVVADLIHTPKEYELAIEIALGGSIQNIVTDHAETAKTLIQYLKQRRFGRATFLPLDSLNTRGGFGAKEALREPGTVGLASSLVQTEPGYKSLAEYLLGKTLVVDAIDHAISIGKKYRHSIRMVTLEGELLNPGGSMTGGAYRNSSNLLGRRREMEELSQVVQRHEEGLLQIQKEIAKLRQQRTQLKEENEDISEQLRQKYIAQNTAKLNLDRLKEEKQQVMGNYAKLEHDKKEITFQTGEIQENISMIQQELFASEQEERELEDFIAFRQEELEALQAEEEQLTRKLETVHLEYVGATQKEAFVNENRLRIKRELEALREEFSQVTDSLKGQEREISEKEDNIEEIQKTIETAGQVKIEDEKLLSEYLKSKEKRNGIHKTFFARRDELSSQMNLLDKECFRLKNQLERLEESQESQINYMWQEYEVTPNNAREYRIPDAPARSALKKSVTAVKDEIRGLGNVNVNAIEEYKEVSERHAFLSEQYNDLVKAEETLKQIIEELDAGMRRQFEEKFRDIQREFDKAFKQLFGGGKGTLELLEEEDILEAGVRIIAQPPGKKLQNMMQLSGGEKALTAIALLFAIQNLKPSPFCLLDEIEAALDDSNVVRYARYLQKLTKNTQFIIITHRRGTMNAADRLYGITMQEKGVSTLVSVDLVEHELDT